MKKIILCSFLLSLLLANTASNAQTDEAATAPKNLVGIRISSRDPVINHSLTYKRFINPTLAIEGLLSFTDPGALGFLLEKHTFFGPSGLSWFWGAGAYAAFSSSRRFGAQGVVGVDYMLPSLPFNLAIDWKPELNFSKIFSFEPAAVAASVRYTF